MKLDKAFVLLTLGRVIQAALALVAIRFLTTLLDKEQVGLTYLVTSIASYFSLVFLNPLGMYFNRRLHHWFKERQLHTAINVLNIYFVAVAFLSVPFVLASYFLLKVGTGFLSWQICVLVLMNIYGITWFQTLLSSINMLEFRTAFVSINLLTQILALAFSILGVLFIERNAFIWLTGLLIGQSIGVLLAWWYLRRHVQDTVSRSFDRSLFFTKEVLFFCIPIALTTAFMWGQTQSYRLIVEAKMGAEALGILGVGLGVATSIAGLIESIVSQHFFPKYYATVSFEGVEARAHAWQQLWRSALAVYIPTTFFVIFGAKFILRILVSASFEESLNLVAWGAAVEFFRIATNILYIVSQSEMKTRSTIIPYMVGAFTVVAGLSLCLRFAEPMRVVYVPMVLAAAGALCCISMFVSMRKILNVRLDLGFIGMALLAGAPLSAMLFFNTAVTSILGSLAVCAGFGIYLLFALAQLYRCSRHSS